MTNLMQEISRVRWYTDPLQCCGLQVGDESLIGLVLQFLYTEVLYFNKLEISDYYHRRALILRACPVP